MKLNENATTGAAPMIDKRSSVRACRMVLQIASLVVLLTGLAACDKCGNSIFRVEAGPLVCKGGEQPR
jgi:hypothetical protein